MSSVADFMVSCLCLFRRPWRRRLVLVDLALGVHVSVVVVVFVLSQVSPARLRARPVPAVVSQVAPLVQPVVCVAPGRALSGQPPVAVVELGPALVAPLAARLDPDARLAL